MQNLDYLISRSYEKYLCDLGLDKYVLDATAKVLFIKEKNDKLDIIEI